MTNNDELALKLKQASDKAVDNFDPNMFILTRDMVALLAERAADKKVIAEQQEHISSLDEGVNMLLAQYDQLASAIGWTTEKALAGEGNQDQYAEAMVKRIAELEARTVSVPTFEEWCQMEDMKPLGWVREAMKEAYDGCRAAAGVNVEFE